MAFQIKDIFSRLYKITFDLFFYSTLFAILLGLLPDQLFNDFQLNPQTYNNEHLFSGLRDLKWNNDLVTKAKRIGQDQLLGPESLTELGDYIYTGLRDGRLVRVHKKTQAIEDIVQFNPSNECGAGITWKFSKCGRWLGLREHNGQIYVLEGDSGLYQVDPKTKKSIHLTENLIPNEPIIYNDLVFDPKLKDLIYISISSNKWFLERLPYSLIEHDKSGYVIIYNISQPGKFVKITDGHGMANGVEITKDQKYLLISETSTYSIKKLELEKARQAYETKEVFNADELPLFGRRLPGEPDNIRLDPSTGDILVGMFSVRPNSRELRDYLSQWPLIRKALARTAYALSIFFKWIDTNLFSNHLIQEMSRDLYSGHIIYKILPDRNGAILKLDGQTGLAKKILGSEQFFGVSEGIIDQNGDLYYGSFRNPFLAVIPKGSH